MDPMILYSAHDARVSSWHKHGTKHLPRGMRKRGSSRGNSQRMESVRAARCDGIIGGYGNRGSDNGHGQREKLKIRLSLRNDLSERRGIQRSKNSLDVFFRMSGHRFDTAKQLHDTTLCLRFMLGQRVGSGNETLMQVFRLQQCKAMGKIRINIGYPPLAASCEWFLKMSGR